MGEQQPAPRFDLLSPASTAASKVKRRNRAQGSAAELALRRALWALGLRYRLHAKDLPGKPDILFLRQRLVVFVDGDFWHGRHWEERRRKLSDGHNAAYWIAKIGYNIQRDRHTTELLQKQGWRVVRLWEKDVLRAPDDAAAAVRDAIDRS
jgi:DNA mismatch endonuclease (patch repair protein)